MAARVNIGEKEREKGSRERGEDAINTSAAAIFSSCMCMRARIASIMHRAPRCYAN